MEYIQWHHISLGYGAGSGDGSLIRLFAFEDAVDDSIWDSGESGELAEAGSLFETGKYYLSA